MDLRTLISSWLRSLMRSLLTLIFPFLAGEQPQRPEDVIEDAARQAGDALLDSLEGAGLTRKEVDVCRRATRILVIGRIHLKAGLDPVEQEQVLDRMEEAAGWVRRIKLGVQIDLQSRARDVAFQYADIAEAALWKLAIAGVSLL